MAEDLKYRHKDGRNLIRITVVRSKKSFLYVTLGALVAAIVVGILLSMYGSSGLNETLNRFIFVPLKTVYLNALRMIVAPVVFSPSSPVSRASRICRILEKSAAK